MQSREINLFGTKKVKKIGQISLPFQNYPRSPLHAKVIVSVSKCSQHL